MLMVSWAEMSYESSIRHIEAPLRGVESTCSRQQFAFVDGVQLGVQLAGRAGDRAGNRAGNRLLDESGDRHVLAILLHPHV